MKFLQDRHNSVFLIAFVPRSARVENSAGGPGAVPRSAPGIARNGPCVKCLTLIRVTQYPRKCK